MSGGGASLEEGAGPPGGRGWWWPIAPGLGIALTLLVAAWVIDVPRHMRWLLYTEQFLAAVLALALPAAFVHVRHDRSRGGPPPWFDLAAAAFGFAAGGYVAIGYPTLAEELAFAPGDGLAVSVVLLVLLLEALRRVGGPVLAVIVAGFIAYGLVGHLVPGRLAGREIAFDRLTTQLMLDSGALLGAPLAIASTVIVVFLVLGQALNRAGGAQFFTDLSMALMGRYRGGPAKIAIIASSLFGSVSGSAVSNVATTGVITIPLMRRAGFSGATAGGIEAVSSTGGQLVPPIMGASAFLMAEFLAVPYSEVVVAALLPALFYYAALFIQADLRAARDGLVGVETQASARRALIQGWVFLAPFAVLIAGIFSFNQAPQTAGMYAIGAMVGLSVALAPGGRRLGVRDLVGVLAAAGLGAVDVIIITAAAGIVIGVLNLSGLSFGLTLILVQLSDQSIWLLLGVAAAISILLGMGMPTIGVYVLLATLIAPSMIKLGIEPMAAHLFVLYFGMMSMITPPVAIAAFAAASLAETPPMRTAFEAMRFGWPAYVMPFLFAFEPTLLLSGSAPAIAVSAASGLAGIWLISGAMAGYLGGRLGAAARLVISGAGALLLLPAHSVSHGESFNVAGAAIAAGALAVLMARRRSSR